MAFGLGDVNDLSSARLISSTEAAVNAVCNQTRSEG